MIVRKTAELWPWKIHKGHGKGHGMSWNFKSFKEYEPCLVVSLRKAGGGGGGGVWALLELTDALLPFSSYREWQPFFRVVPRFKHSSLSRQTVAFFK